MGHKMILDKMKQMGAAAGRELVADPTNGYLANLSIEDYKRFFRPYIPEFVKGGQFLLQYGSTIDKATTVEPDFNYPVQHATDHHVLEANRVREFVRHLEHAATLGASDPTRQLTLDKAGHLMYASHLSTTNDAMLGSPECDTLVDLVRRRESAGLYGARMTARASGGTVAVLCDASATADAAIEEILALYREKTGKLAEASATGSPSAWSAGTIVV
jgi:galactokinase